MNIKNEIDKIGDNLEDMLLKIKNIESFNYFIYQELANAGNSDVIDRLYSLSTAITNATDSLKATADNTIKMTYDLYKIGGK